MTAFQKACLTALQVSTIILFAAGRGHARQQQTNCQFGTPESSFLCTYPTMSDVYRNLSYFALHPANSEAVNGTKALRLQNLRLWSRTPVHTHPSSPEVRGHVTEETKPPDTEFRG